MPLLAIFMVLVSLVLFVIETTAYLTMMKWYYRLGPTIRDQRWQLSGDVARVGQAIDAARESLKLRSTRRGDWFFFRFRWWELSIWSRVSLHVEPTSHGAAIVYEFRPFVSPAVLALSILLFFEIGAFRVFAIGYLLLVISMYAAGLWWDLRKIKSLEPLRKPLAELGLAICSQCGYDRFGLAADAACPECGRRDLGIPPSVEHVS